MTIHGLDVSYYQGSIDWRRVVEHFKAINSNVVPFAAMKATEGLSYLDPTFPLNWHGAKLHGATRIAYHFLRPETSGKDQARYFHEYVKHSGGFHNGDAIMVDLEVFDGVTSMTVKKCLVDFITYCLKYIKRQVCIYTGTYVWRTLGNPQDPIFTQRPLWIAAYQQSVPQALPGFKVLSFWQYTDSGSVPGIATSVDLDTFFGNHKQLQEVLKAP